MVARELRALGFADRRLENGKVSFAAAIEAIPELTSRCARRPVLLKMGSFRAYSFDELFEQTKASRCPIGYPERHFPVIGRSHKSRLFSVSDARPS